MAIILENFFPGDPQNSLKEHHAKDVYQKLSILLTKAHAALIRIAYDDKEKERFAQWFGNYSIVAKHLVFNNIRAIHNMVVQREITFRNGGAACRPGDFAYVRLDTGLAKVYLCSHFFNSGRIGIDNAVGTIIHELSHLVANTHDFVYGQEKCRLLAINRPEAARSNADNYQYYCESFA